MPRIRTIKPEFWESETIAFLSRDARLLFICCLNIADDEGLLRWSAPYLKSAAFPYDDDLLTDSVSDLMNELVNAKLIHPFTGGKMNGSYGWIISFHEHQKINRPTPSKLPAPSLQNPKIREIYAERDGWVCQISGKKIEALSERHRGDKGSLSLDHIKPKSKGGSDYPSNIRAARQDANKSLGNRNDLFTESLTESLITGKERKGKERKVVIEKGIDKSIPKKKTLSEAFTCPDWLDENTWNEYFAWRGRKGYPTSVQAKKLLVTEIEKYRQQGHDPDELLRNAFLNGWKSVYPKTTQNQGKPNETRNKNLEYLQSLERQAEAEKALERRAEIPAKQESFGSF